MNAKNVFPSNVNVLCVPDAAISKEDLNRSKAFSPLSRSRVILSILCGVFNTLDTTTKNPAFGTSLSMASTFGEILADI